jgi:hypothetical protein
MARYKVQGPDGAVHVFEGPDDATPEQVVAAAAAQFGQASQPRKQSFAQDATQFGKNLLGGAVRGAGSIGATLLTPVDAAARAMGVQNDFIGRTDRRAQMDSALQGMGAETDSLAFGAGKLGTEIAGTLGVGGALANTVGRVLPSVAARAPGVVEAIRTSGMTAGAPGQLATRAVGGGIAGGAAAGLVNPEDVAGGALIGAAAPGALQLAGRAGAAVGRTLTGPVQTPDMAAAVQAARNAGYVIPPTQAKPSLGNRLLEGYAGKLTTAQNASARNQPVTNKLAAEAIGLPGDVKLTPEVLDTVREEAGKAYAAVASLPNRPAIAADALTNTQAVEGLNPKAAVFDLRKARNDATAWFRSYGRTADPDSLAKAQAASAEAKRLETSLEEYAASLGRDDLVPALREARQLIAKTYSVEGALNPVTGTVDAKKLAAQLAKGKPLSGGLKDAASFASQFKTASQPIEAMGSLPQLSPLDFAVGGGIAASLSNPLALAAILGRPMARAATLSGPVQNNLIQGQGGRLAALLANPALEQRVYQSAPLLGVDQ